MADYTPEQVAEAAKISAWAAEKARAEDEARRAAYRNALRPIVTDATYAAVRSDLRDLVATTTADGNLSMHVAAILAAMDRLAAEPL
ncbi:hypothetical protein [Sphingomonas sp.]|uniref:hypothetical protein n=1 Tax=Sphingomonas sp. TaxID=28214 RepID=UPI0031DB2ACC